MEKILADKLNERNRLVSLPFEEKLTLLEKMRDRSLLIQRPTVVTVSGAAVEFEELHAHSQARHSVPSSPCPRPPPPRRG